MSHAPNEGKVPSVQPYFPPDEIDWILGELRGVLESGKLVRGPRVVELERAFAALTGTRHAIAVSSGTQALELALRRRALDGGEVIVPTNTFLASANAVLLAGGKPVFADIDAKSLCVGLPQIEAQLTSRTRGVMVVHIGGVICPDIEAIVAFCRARGLFLVEDASHAHGARWRGKRAGAFSDVGAFSLFPTKPMTTGEGGLITTDDEGMAEFARLFRNHGTPDDKTSNDALGSNYRMDELRAVLGISQVRRLDEFLAHRRGVAAAYQRGLAGIDGLELLPIPDGMEPSYYKYATVLPTAPQRQAVAKGLRERHRIDTGTLYWPPCHLQPVVRARPDLYGEVAAMPVAEAVLPRVLCLPISAKLDEATVARVIAAVRTEVRAAESAATPRAAAGTPA